MKSTPKLQDTLEVFLEQLEGIKSVIGEMQEIIPSLSSTIKEIKSIQIEPNLKPLQVLQTNYKYELSDEINRLSTVFHENQTNLKTIFDENKQKISSFYYYILVSSLITLVALYFGINGRLSQSNLQTRVEIYKNQNMELENYILDSQQIEKYNSWRIKTKSK